MTKSETFLEYKRLLFSVAYNMLGDVEAAEDMVQDTFLKWIEFDDREIQHPKAYLVKTVTNKCINYLNAARQQREEYIGTWLPEPLVSYDLNNTYARIESYHALSIGLLFLMEKLTPMERAIFLLREVFSYDYVEMAEMFDKTEDNCRQIFKRAKDNLGRDIKRFEVDIKIHEKMLHNFMSAVSEGNVNNLIDLLKEDIVLFGDGGGYTFHVKSQRLTAPMKPIKGRDNVSRLLFSSLQKIQELPDFRNEVIMANGLPSIISFSKDIPVAIVSVEHDGHRINNIYIQTNPSKLRQFDNKPSSD